MNVLMVVAPSGFGDPGLVVPRTQLVLAGHRVTLASSRAGTCTSSLGARELAELSLSEANATFFDGAVFVGGTGARVLFDDPDARRLARDLARAQKVTAAICIAPTILARAGVLTGKRATTFYSEVPALIAARALVRALPVVVDGPVITASGSEHAPLFAAAVVHGLEKSVARRERQLARDLTAVGH